MNNDHRTAPRHQTGGGAHGYYPDDEINLYNLWDVLVRRRCVIAGIALLVIISGLAYALMKPVVYEFSTGIEIGQVYYAEEAGGGSYQLVESPEAAQARLEDELILRVRRALFDGEEAAPKVTVQTRTNRGSLVLISTVREAQSEAVESLHEAIANALQEVHQRPFEREKRMALARHKPVEETLFVQLDLLESQLSMFGSSRANGDPREVLVEIVSSQWAADLRREAAEARVELAKTKGNIAAVEEGSRPTQLAYLAKQADTPAGSGKSLILALSVVLAGMLGILTAFFAEFASNARNR